MIGTDPKLGYLSILLLRVTLGVILFVAGSGKVFGWFGGYGMQATIQGFQSGFGIPAFLTYLSTYTELIGAVLIAVGLLTRLSAIAVTINMLVATILMLKTGFIGANGGAAFPFSILMISVTILLVGPLPYSLDQLIFNRKK